MTDPINGSCHCGAVTFEVRLSDGLRSARRCDCSMCSRRGAVAVSALLDGIRYTSGEALLTCYQFGTRTAEHYFCSRCGIYTHHKRRSTPTQIGVNLACLDGHTPFLPVVEVLDGQNHPQDTGTLHIAGTLTYEENTE